MKNKFLGFIIILIFSTLSCGGFSDHIENLGENYYYVVEGSELNYIARGEDNKIDFSPQGLIVPPNILDFKFNTKWIIVKQSEGISKNTVDYIKELFEVNLEKTDKVNFYIIDKINKIIFRPKDEVELNKIFLDQRIPKELDILKKE